MTLTLTKADVQRLREFTRKPERYCSLCGGRVYEGPCVNDCDARIDTEYPYPATNMLPALLDALERMDAALAEVERDAACMCDECYTGRGLHEPNALCYLSDVAREARLHG